MPRYVGLMYGLSLAMECLTPEQGTYLLTYVRTYLLKYLLTDSPAYLLARYPAGKSIEFNPGPLSGCDNSAFMSAYAGCTFRVKRSDPSFETYAVSAWLLRVGILRNLAKKTQQ